MSNPKLFDVIAVNLATKRVRILDKNLTERNADAVADMAVMRRGVETEIFTKVMADSHKEGDLWVLR